MPIVLEYCMLILFLFYYDSNGYTMMYKICNRWELTSLWFTLWVGVYVSSIAGYSYLGECVDEGFQSENVSNIVKG